MVTQSIYIEFSFEDQVESITMVKITIIIPVYNAELYLPRCIESVLKQTYSNLQILLIDDGSDDTSLEICMKYAKEDSRIEVYHINNCGSVAARKYGLELAVGEYIGFVDADDYIDCNMFFELMNVITRNNSDFVHCGYVEEKGETTNIIANFEEGTLNANDIESKIVLLKKYILEKTNENFLTYSLWSKFFKADFIKSCFKALSDEQQYGEDLLCLYRCILESRRFTLYKCAMYHYTVRKNSLSHPDNEGLIIKEIGLWHNLIKTAKEYECFEMIKGSVFQFIKKRMLEIVSVDGINELKIPRFFYKDIDKIAGKRIILFGAGSVGQDYYSQICKYQNSEIVAWVDSKWDKFNFDYATVVDPRKIDSMVYDMIIVAVGNKNMALEIMRYLENIGIHSWKIDWQAPGIYY